MSLDAYIEVSKNEKELEKKYLSELLTQYSKITGDYSNLGYQSLIEWYEERETLSEHYKELLDSLDVDYKTPACAEVGKGKFDTIVSEEFTTILSPYYKQKSINSFGYILKGNLKVLNPFIHYSKTNLFKSKLISLDDFEITRLMTQNIYSPCEIENFHKIANLRIADITVGAYGKIYDQNRTEQIKNLKILRDKLKCEFFEQDVKNDYEYYYVLTTDCRK